MCLRAFGRLDLDQVVELEAVAVKVADALAVRKGELHAVGPLDTAEAELRRGRGSRRRSRLSSHAELRERRAAQEDQPAAGSQEPRGLGHPALGIDPDRGAVFGEREVEARRRQSRVTRVRLDERELDPGLRHHPPRGLELGRGDVDADRPCAEPCEDGRHVRGAAAELDDVEAAQVAHHPELGIGHAPDPPRDLGLFPLLRRLLVGVLGVDLRPERAVQRRVVSPGQGAPPRSAPSENAAPRPSPRASGRWRPLPRAAGPRRAARS